MNCQICGEATYHYVCEECTKKVADYDILYDAMIGLTIPPLPGFPLDAFIRGYINIATETLREIDRETN